MNKQKNIKLMYLIVFLQGLVFYGPVATLYRETRGISLSQIFVIESISYILVVLLEIPWGYFADRFGYKRTLLISNFIFFISKIVFFISNSFNMFLLERILLSLAVSGLSGCDIAYLYSLVDKEKDNTKVFSRYNFFSQLGFLIACISSSFISTISLSATALFTIIPYGIASFSSFFLIDTIKDISYKPDLSKNFKVLLNNKNIIYFLISFALISTIAQSVTVFLNQNQYIKVGIHIKYFGLLMTFSQLLNLICIKAYHFSSKFGERKYITFLYTITGASCVVLSLTNSSLVSILTIFIISTSMSLLSPIVVSIQNKSISSEDRATVLSIYSMFISITSTLINLVIGFSTNISIEFTFVICVFLSIIATILFKKYKF